jgi:uncharacterized protein
MPTQTNRRTAPDHDLRAMIAEPQFPCVGAKSVMARGALKIVSCASLTSNEDDARIHAEMLDWGQSYRADPEEMRSLAMVFDAPAALSETAFEAAMWARLQALADKDRALGQPYDARVSADPDDPHFSLSFGGEGFFVVGMHPNASRPARRAPSPTLVFNLHDQFERLRQENHYERMRERILERDLKLAGSLNPMLARHGLKSEARQYSGRAVNDDWKCPFRDARA